MEIDSSFFGWFGDLLRGKMASEEVQIKPYFKNHYRLLKPFLVSKPHDKERIFYLTLANEDVVGVKEYYDNNLDLMFKDGKLELRKVCKVLTKVVFLREILEFLFTLPELDCSNWPLTRHHLSVELEFLYPDFLEYVTEFVNAQKSRRARIFRQEMIEYKKLSKRIYDHLEHRDRQNENNSFEAAEEAILSITLAVMKPKR